MKFRILEVKEHLYKPVFYPQYKTFLFWKNIGDSWFTKTVFNDMNEFTESQPWVHDKFKAKNIIDNFKSYLKTRKKYSLVHPVE